jgi:hypothetical protein
MPMTSQQVTDNLALLQFAYSKTLAPNPIDVDTKLKGLTKKQGQDDYVDDTAFRESIDADTAYSTNVARILDYLMLHFTDVVADIVNKYDSPLKKAANVPGDVKRVMKQYVSPAIAYLDDDEGIPHITSMKVYTKVAYLTWFLLSVVNWSNDHGKIFKTVVETFIGIKLKPLELRLQKFEEKNKLPVKFSYEAVDEELKEIAKAHGPQATVTTAPNGQTFFAPPSPTRQAANSGVVDEEKKVNRLG